MNYQIHVLTQVLEKSIELNISAFHLLIDFKSTYDGIKKDKLLKATDELKIPVKLINLSRAIRLNESGVLQK